MSNATSSNAQQLFDRMDFKKLKPLNSSLKDIAEDLREQLKNEFDLKNLSYEDRKDLRKGVEKIIKDTEGLSEMDKKRYFVLLQELTFHYPPQEKLTKINEKRLTLRDQLAENLKTNRDENWNNHVNIGFPVGQIKLERDTFVTLADLKIYPLLEKEYKKVLEITDKTDKALRLRDIGLSELDRKFAERIILEKKGYIQLDNDGEIQYPGELEREAYRAVKRLKHQDINTEYVQFIEVVDTAGKLEESYKRELEEKIKALKLLEESRKDGKLTSLEGIRKVAYERLLSKDFTVKKLQQRIRSLKSDVKKLPAISERPRIYEDALKHLDEENNKKHHIIRLVSKEKKEDLEKETKRLTLKVDGELETELKMGTKFVAFKAKAELGEDDVSDDIKVKIKDLKTGEIIENLKQDEVAEKIDTGKEGEYEIIYTITKKEIKNGEEKETPTTLSEKRIVKIREGVETFKPNLSLDLKGEDTIELEVGENYREPGYIAKWRPKGQGKSEAEDITNEVQVIGLDDLDTSIPGIYRITYRVEKDYIDAEGRYMGMNAVDERTVIVKEKTEPLDPIDPESVDFEDDLNVAGVLSDESTSFDEKLSRLVETDLQKEWADAAKLNLFKRGYLFLSRGRKRRKLLKEKLRSEKSKIFDTEAVAQADRHDIERTLYDDGGIETKISLDNPTKLNEIARKYLENSDETTAAAEFERDFLDFVEKEPHIKRNKRDMNIKFMGTNMLEQLKAKKAERILRKEISGLFSQYIRDKNEAHLNEANQKIAKYVEDFKRDPIFRKMLLNADGTIDPADEAKMNKFIQHQTAVEQAGLKNLSTKLDLLTKGKGAYEIDNKDREVGKSAWLFKFGRWLDKKPWYAQVGAMAGLGIATSLTAGALGGAFAAGLATTIAMSGAVGFKNFVKKWTHHTKEQNTHEKNLVRDYDKVTKRMELWRQDMGNNWLGKWIPGKRYKGKRQRELYDQTTQHNFADTKETTDFIMAGLTKLKPTSSAYDKNQYNFAVMEAKARLDMYKQSGHNFLKSNEASKIEQDMRELERALLLVVQREGADVKSGLSAIEGWSATDYDGNATSYEDIKKALTEDYDKATKKFRKERSLLARKRGLATAAITAGTSVGSQYLFKTGMFASEPNPVTTVIDPGRQEMNVDVSGQQFDLSKAELIDGNLVYTQSQNIFSNLGKGDVVELYVGAGTDGTTIRGAEGLANLTNLYTTKLDVVRGLAESSQLANKSDIITLIDQLKAGSNSTLWTADRAGKGFLSDQLHGARCLELLEETLRGAGNSEATLNLFYDSANSIAGTSRNTASERVGNAFFKVLEKATKSTTTGGTTPRWRKALFFPIPRFSNTLQRQRKETDEELEDVVYRGDVPENRRDNPSGDPDNERNDPPENPEDENKRKEIKKFWEDFDRKTKFVPYKPVDPEKEPEKFYKDDFSDRKLDKRTPGTKQTVNTRGQKIEGYDSFDYGTGYPEAGKRPSISELSHKIFTETSLFPEDQQEILSLRKRGATMDEVGEFIKKKITKEREKAEIKKGKRQFNALLDQCYNKIPEYLSKILGSDITEKFNIPLSKDRVHLVGDAEYRAVAGPTSSGVFRTISGDIYVSQKAIEKYENEPPIGVITRSANGGTERIEFPRIFREIKHILIHEMLHSMSVLNYANIKDTIYPRRLGLLHWNTMKGIEHGRNVNEPTTENLTQTILRMLYHDEGLQDSNYEAPWIAYPHYLITIQKLVEIDGIEWSDFYTAMLLRRYGTGEKIEKNTPLFKLVAKVNGGTNPATAERPYYYQLIMNLLDNGFPTQASNFIKTKDMNVFLKEIGKDKAISKVFSSILLNKDKTDFREEILKAYGGEKDNDDEDVKKEKIAREERMRKIKTFFPKSKVLQRALENTTEGTESLIIADPGKEGKLPNEWLNDHRNWEDLHQFLPNLKNLTLEGKNNMLLSTRKGTTFNLHEWIFTGFRTQLEELIVPDNYIEDLSRLRKTDDGEKITLKKIDFTRNKIQTLSYDDFMDLPEGTEVIIKENPINADATALQKFKDGLDFSGVQAKFIWE